MGLSLYVSGRTTKKERHPHDVVLPQLCTALRSLPSVALSSVQRKCLYSTLCKDDVQSLAFIFAKLSARESFAKLTSSMPLKAWNLTFQLSSLVISHANGVKCFS